MTAVPRYRADRGPTVLSAGFRPFFLASSVWAAIAVPVWLCAYADGLILPSELPPAIWHAHEMIFGFAAATVAGFLLTAIPNWTGRLPLQGRPLAVLVFLWAIGRVAVLFSTTLGAPAAALADLSFPAVFLAVVAREIIAGRNRRNLPMLIALSLLLTGNLLVHLEALGTADTAQFGNRLGLVTLLLLISLIGGRIIPSFTRNWLAKTRPDGPMPASADRFDVAALVVTAVALLAWAFAPELSMTSWTLIVAGIAAAARLSRWRGPRTRAEPLLLVLHVGYGWLAVGLLLLGANGLTTLLPATAALHVLTVGAIGTMTLAVMTRATLGHTGRPLVAGPVTKLAYALVTIAAILRALSPFAGARMELALWLAGMAWSSAFALFALGYGPALLRPPINGTAPRPI